MVENFKFSSTQIEDVLKSNYRLEASFFSLEAKQAREILNQCNCKLIPIFSSTGDSLYDIAIDGYRFARKYVKPNDGIAFLGGSEILNINPRKDCKYLSVKTNKKILESLMIKPFTLLITAYGTLGNVMLSTHGWENCAVSENIIQLPINNRTQDIFGYIYAFLKTKIGKVLLTTNETGSTVSYMKPSSLQFITIPLAEIKLMELIHKKVINSFELRDNSNELINSAEKLLTDSLSLPKIEELNPKFFKSSSDIQNYIVPLELLNNRLDGSYHIPIANSIIDRLLDNSEKILSLGNRELTANIFLPGRFKRVYVEADKGKVFFGGKQIYEIDPSNKKYLSLSQHGNRIQKELLLHENMILVTRSGTVGRVNIVPKHWENWVANDHILRVTPVNKEVAGYLYIWLNSEYGRILIERFVYGAVVDEIEEDHLSNVLVPILKDKATMKKINDLALEANKLRSEAYYLEQEAIKMVNEEVIFAKS